MSNRIRVINVELNQLLEDITGLSEFDAVKVIVWLHHQPLGEVLIPLHQGCCSVSTLVQETVRLHGKAMVQQLVVNGLTLPSLEHFTLESLLAAPTAPLPISTTSLSVVICCSSEVNGLDVSLKSLAANHCLPLEVLILQYGDSSHDFDWLTQFPLARYLHEPQSNISAARNRAISEAKGDVIAFLDIGYKPHVNWVGTLIRSFDSHPQAMVVTGATLADSLDNPAQQLADQDQAAWANRFEQRSVQLPSGEPIPRTWLNTQQFGTGANIAFRRELFSLVGNFQLQFGSQGLCKAGMMDLLFRLLQRGYGLVYEPAAMVLFTPTSEYPLLRQKIIAESTDLFAYFVGVAKANSRHWLDFILIAQWFLRTTLMAWCQGDQSAKQLAVSRLKGYWQGARLGHGAKPLDKTSQKQFLETVENGQPARLETDDLSLVNAQPSLSPKGIRSIDLTQLPERFESVVDLDSVRFLVSWQEQVWGWVTLNNHHLPVTRHQIGRAVADQLAERLSQVIVSPIHQSDYNSVIWQNNALITWNAAFQTLAQYYGARRNKGTMPSARRLPMAVPVSIVIATYDRPDDLRACLQAIIQQETERFIEIIVVDNHPASGLTPPIVADFPQVKVIQETRQGSAYARNTGIVESRGDIIVTTDDDVVTPPNWLEKLLAPFVSPQTMVVTGNILPFTLETPAQQLFEKYCSLSVGFREITVDGPWFKASPTAVLGWEFGATANAAFRAQLFSDPAVGLMEETLGPGTPAGAGEDPYMFYRVLKAGYQLHYTPDAYVWHKHRRTVQSLRRQTYNYGKSAVAYHLTTLLKDGDRRALRPLCGELQRYYGGRLVAALKGQIDYPKSLILQEILGHLMGPWGFIRSHIRVKRLGRSTPVSNRSRRDNRQSENTNAQSGGAAEVEENLPLQEAKALATQKKWGQAIALYRRLIEQSPMDVAVHEGLADTLLAQGKDPEAITAYETVTTLQADRVHAYHQLGELWRKQNKGDKAVAVYQRLTALKPNHYWYHCCLGDAYTQQGLTDQAIECYRDAARRKTHNLHLHYGDKVDYLVSEELDDTLTPSFILNGFAKCGTTSLYEYLANHPQFLPPIKKEVCFFNAHYDQGRSWYLAHFPVAEQGPVPLITGEASTRYIDQPIVHQRVKAFNPAMKFIVMMRHPVDRTISDYYMAIRFGLLKNRPFDDVITSRIQRFEASIQTTVEDAVQRSGPDYLTSSLYLYRIKQWMSLFPREQFLFLKSEDFFADPASTLEQVFEFLQLPPFQLSQYEKYNAASYRKVSDQTYQMLVDYFKPHNQLLEDYLNLDFNWSSASRVSPIL